MLVKAIKNVDDFTVNKVYDMSKNGIKDDGNCRWIDFTNSVGNDLLEKWNNHWGERDPFYKLFKLNL